MARIVYYCAETVSKMWEKSVITVSQHNVALLVKPCRAGIVLEHKTQGYPVFSFAEMALKIMEKSAIFL